MTQENTISPRPRVLSGMRPTGRLHLGNYMGALYNWVQLQHQYECYFFIADYHALTTDYADTGNLKDNIREVILDFLAAGLDPALCTIFVQSKVPAHFELNDLLGMITPISWLERVPTYKDQQEQLKEKDLATFGFLGYPLLQSADILLYQASFVPVGQDQAAHVELTREVARRFNQLYPGDFHLSPNAAPWEMPAIEEKARKLAGDLHKTTFTPHELQQAALQTKKLSGFGRREILPEPQVLLTPSPKLPGTDGRKMSKSYGNTILLSDPEPEIRRKLKTMVTDPARVRREDPGNPSTRYSPRRRRSRRPAKAAPRQASAVSSVRAGSPTPSSRNSLQSRSAVATSKQILAKWTPFLPTAIRARQLVLLSLCIRSVPQ